MTRAAGLLFWHNRERRNVRLDCPPAQKSVALKGGLGENTIERAFLVLGDKQRFPSCPSDP